ncbi:acyl-[acyl-carrier-protein]--udp-n-acetylglucosamine o-acyltransferase [Lucifera butyrica]|uniref:Acyl-[acyl-carrier-protein]--UDP-N-acetylglucosamine O-acyltransferase n=1 Tax=Lucifera butyrica TaxID=1351585 RepID=A0A498RC90_9FIRM|nr:acyl-ACP--UDP-N-acetylglucosamine O-acyltransferase [Lucifera butyrica]VBB09144.1 acyl-[acyl-carrier-protein]--udp-n-acetylglucosamine o-acyltransferase [Lucifera butyrica]
MIQNLTNAFISNNLHKTAVIHPNAKLGKDVEVGPYSVIGPNVTIGDGTKIDAHTVIKGWTKIGKNCLIYSHAVIGSEPQDRKFLGEKSYVILGDGTQVREFVTINRATGENLETKIGSDCLLLAYSHVAHNCTVGNHVTMSNAATLAGHVTVEDKVTIGGLAGIHQFVRVGRNAMIGGLSKVVQDVPPFITVDGNPAYAAGLNTVGLIRAGMNETTRRILKRAYKILYLSGWKLSQAVAIMEQQLPLCSELEDLIRFLQNTERGICRVANHKN